MSVSDAKLHTAQDICRKIAKQGPSYVLLKGGHSASQGILDIFYDKAKDSFTTFRHRFVVPSNHDGLRPE